MEFILKIVVYYFAITRTRFKSLYPRWVPDSAVALLKFNLVDVYIFEKGNSVLSIIQVHNSIFIN